jgi:hypothetical protein
MCWPLASGARYDNPALCFKRASLKAKKLKLPEFDKFNDFVATMEVAGGRFSRRLGRAVLWP